MSEASSTIEKLEERLKCVICLEIYTDPKQLQCFHFHCRDCLVRLVVRDQQGQLVLPCPTCRQVTPIPANGVTGLQSAFHVKELLEVLREQRKLLSGQGKQSCSIHKDKELELYCETCGELICCHCSLKGQKHQNHECDLIGSCYEKYKREIPPSLESVENQLTTVSRVLVGLDQRRQEIHDQQVTTEGLICHSIEQIHAILNDRKTELINQLNQRIQEKLKALEIQKNKIETIQVQLMSCHTFLKESLETSSQGDVLKMKASIIEQVKELAATSSQPDILKPNSEADINFMTSPFIAGLCQNYGQISTGSDQSVFRASNKEPIQSGLLNLGTPQASRKVPISSGLLNLGSPQASRKETIPSGLLNPQTSTSKEIRQLNPGSPQASRKETIPSGLLNPQTSTSKEIRQLNLGNPQASRKETIPSGLLNPQTSTSKEIRQLNLGSPQASRKEMIPSGLLNPQTSTSKEIRQLNLGIPQASNPFRFGQDKNSSSTLNQLGISSFNFGQSSTSGNSQTITPVRVIKRQSRRKKK